MMMKHRLFRTGIIALGIFVLHGCASQTQNTIDEYSIAGHDSSTQSLVHDTETFTVPVIRVGRYKLVTQDVKVISMSQLPIALNLSNDETYYTADYIRLETAIASVIAQSGYSLCSSEAVDQLIQRAVPKEHYQLGPMTRANMLQVLVGSEWTVDFNQSTGTVCFEPNTDVAGNPS